MVTGVSGPDRVLVDLGQSAPCKVCATVEAARHAEFAPQSITAKHTKEFENVDGIEQGWR